MTNQSEFLTIKEAATFAGKSEQTVRRAIKKGDLKATKVSGKYQVLVTNLIVFYKLDSNKMPNQPANQVTSQVTNQGEIDALKDLIAIIKAELAQKNEQLRAKAHPSAYP